MMQKQQPQQQLNRLAVVNPDRCRPKECKHECKKICPVVKMGRMAIEVEASSKMAKISEQLCVSCGICQKRCPFNAIDIINLPTNLSTQTTHRYGVNAFKLHRLPIPRMGQVLGIVGANGTGKSSALMILAGRLRPNLGNYDVAPEWRAVLDHFRGNELQGFLTKVATGIFRVALKPQYVDAIPRTVKGTVREVLMRKDARGVANELIEQLQLTAILDRELDQLSGGELQRFAIAVTACQDVDMWMFDEASSYLDVFQRLQCARVIRGLCDNQQNYVVVVEHDLALLDYMADHICFLYGKPSTYGVVTAPFTVREGINVFLSGFLPTENMRFRDTALSFRIAQTVEVESDEDVRRKRPQSTPYPAMTINFDGFSLQVAEGGFNESEIVLLLGKNGTGKTCLIKALAGLLKPSFASQDDEVRMPQLRVSYKPQMISPKYEGTVRQLLHTKIIAAMTNAQFQSDVLRPMNLTDLLDRTVKTLSGGELQRVAIVLALGKPADIYLIDEPSSYLDSEARIITARVIKRFIMNTRKTAFIVEHDFMMATYLADRVIVYSGEPAVSCVCSEPMSLQLGMNTFLRDLGVSFRRDAASGRPRINKFNSIKDREQKASGMFFYMAEDAQDTSE